MMRKRFSIALIVVLFILLLSCNAQRTINNTYEIGVLTFPKDFAPHHEFSTEWWYQTGVLNNGRFGYELTIFRRYDPEAENWPKVFSVPFGELWLVHVMVHDFKSNERIFKEYAILPPFLVAGESIKELDGGLRLYYNGVNFQLDWRNSIEKFHIFFEDNYITIDFDLIAKKLPVAHNNGIISMGNLGKSYYYSITNLKVSGTLRVKNNWYDVEGKSWIDQQWGSFASPPWEWFSIRLNNGMEIMIYFFPETDAGFGTVVKPDGETIDLSREDFSITYEKTVKDSEGDIIRIPMLGHIEIPLFDISLTITALSKDQFNRAKYTPEYWEGLCRVEGSMGDDKIAGWAFYETWR